VVTPIWPQEGVALNSTGELVANSLGDVANDTLTAAGGIEPETDKIDQAAVDGLGGTAGSLAYIAATIEVDTNKIDEAATTGLTGTHDSLAYRMAEIDRHIHGRERWWGAVAVPDETDAIEANVTRPFAATSGADTWGTAIPIVGTDDVPSIAGDAYWDAHRIMVTDLDDETDTWRFRLIYGTGTSGDAITAGQWTEVMLQSNAVPGNRAGGQPVDIIMRRVASGTKLWAQAWNDTNGEVLSFFLGVHGYEG